MITTLSVIHAIISVLLIFAVLLHFGKGAEAGLVLDTTASSIIPQKGNFLTKIATILAVLFFSLSLTLAIMRGKMSNQSIFDSNVLQKAAAAAAAANTNANTSNNNTNDVVNKAVEGQKTTTAPVDSAPANK